MAEDKQLWFDGEFDDRWTDEAWADDVALRSKSENAEILRWLDEQDDEDTEWEDELRKSTIKMLRNS